MKKYSICRVSTLSAVLDTYWGSWNMSSTDKGDYYTQRIKGRISIKYLYPHVNSSIIHNKKKKVTATQVFTNRWMKNQNVVYLYTMKYHSALKREKSWNMLQPGWTFFEDILLSEISQLQKKTYTVWSHLSLVPRVVIFSETESRTNGGWQCLGVERNEQITFNGHEISVLQDEDVLETNDSDGCTIMWMY